MRSALRRIQWIFIGLWCQLHVGFHALILGLICFIISFLVQDVFHNNFLTGLIMMLAAILIVILLQWLFLYILKGYDAIGYVLYRHYLPRAALYFSVGSFVLLFQSGIFLHLTRRTFPIVKRKNILFTDFFSFVHPSVI